MTTNNNKAASSNASNIKNMKPVTIYKILSAIYFAATIGFMFLPMYRSTLGRFLDSAAGFLNEAAGMDLGGAGTLTNLLSNPVEGLAALLIFGFVFLFQLIMLIVSLAATKGKGAYITGIVLTVFQGILYGLFAVFTVVLSIFGGAVLAYGYYLSIALVVIKLATAITFLVIGKNAPAAEKSPARVNRDYSFKNKGRENETVVAEHKVLVIAGEYTGAQINLKNGEKIVIGRDSSRANLVLSNKNISGVHVEVYWSDLDKKYHVVDRSKNGVFFANDMRLMKNTDVSIAPNTEIKLAGGSDRLLFI